MGSLLFNRMRTRGAYERVLRERLSEPLHLNLVSLFIMLFGSLKAKVYFDLMYRQYTAFCLLDAAERARASGYSKVSALEFGVATGAGLLNICEISEKVTRATGISFKVFGFDTGEGLPEARDYRDHPELYQGGDYAMQSHDVLRSKLPSFATLLLGPIADTVNEFRNTLSPESPIGYVALDVDYYFSAVDALQVFDGSPEIYLPMVNLYLDDTHDPYHNPAAGELLAIAEFNRDHPMRQVFPYTALSEKRLFKNASWISKIYAMHIMDHPQRSRGVNRSYKKNMENPYIEAS
jgi:hypothetical protein